MVFEKCLKFVWMQRVLGRRLEGCGGIFRVSGAEVVRKVSRGCLEGV